MEMTSERALEDELFAAWWDLRSSRRVGSSLWRTLGREDEYENCHVLKQGVIRQFRLPCGAADGCGHGYVDLLEVVVTTERRRDLPAWYPVLYCTIVELKNDSISLGHVAQVVRYKHSLTKMLARGLPRNVRRHVDCLLIGTQVPTDVARVVDEMEYVNAEEFAVNFSAGFESRSSELGMFKDDPIASNMNEEDAYRQCLVLLDGMKSVFLNIRAIQGV